MDEKYDYDHENEKARYYITYHWVGASNDPAYVAWLKDEFEAAVADGNDGAADAWGEEYDRCKRLNAPDDYERKFFYVDEDTREDR